MWGFLPPSVAKNLAKIIIYDPPKLNQCRNARHSVIPNAAMPGILSFPMPDPLAFKNPLLTANARPLGIPNAAMPDILSFPMPQCQALWHTTETLPKQNLKTLPPKHQSSLPSAPLIFSSSCLLYNFLVLLFTKYCLSL